MLESKISGIQEYLHFATLAPLSVRDLWFVVGHVCNFLAQSVQGEQYNFLHPLHLRKNLLL